MAMSQRESARNEGVGGEVEEAAAGGAVSGEGAAAAEAVAAARLSALGLGALGVQSVAARPGPGS